MRGNWSWGFLILWEFRVPPEHRERFERSYGPEGDWVRLFRRSPDYLGTELAHDQKDPERYLTLDFWKSEQAFQRFKDENHDDYVLFDERLEKLTWQEVQLGAFFRSG